MTRKSVERITGYTVKPVDSDGYKVGFAAFDGLAEIVRAYGYTSGAALHRLADLVYKRHSNAAMVRDRFRCTECGSVRNLTTDHRQPRSKGRDDRVANLRTLCLPCHERRHRKSREFQ